MCTPPSTPTAAWPSARSIDDERGPTCAGFFQRAQAFFADHGITTIDAVLTDNAKNYLGTHFTAALAGIEHRRIRPYTPRTNGKVERFNRTLLEEWAYIRPYLSDSERTAALDDWLDLYNHHRHHTATRRPTHRTAVNDLPWPLTYARMRSPSGS